MIKSKLRIVFSLFIFSLFSCDPVYDIDITIENKTSNNIQIITSDYWPDSPPDTNNISADTKLVLFNLWGIGSSTEDKLKNLEELPFDTIDIRNKEGIFISKNTLDLSNWEKINPEYEGAQAEVLIIIEDNDFN